MALKALKSISGESPNIQDLIGKWPALSQFTRHFGEWQLSIEAKLWVHTVAVRR